MVKYVHWEVKFKRSKFLNFLAYLNYLKAALDSFISFFTASFILFVKEKYTVQPEQHVDSKQ